MIISNCWMSCDTILWKQWYPTPFGLSLFGSNYICRSYRAEKLTPNLIPLKVEMNLLLDGAPQMVAKIQVRHWIGHQDLCRLFVTFLKGFIKWFKRKIDGETINSIFDAIWKEVNLGWLTIINWCLFHGVKTTGIIFIWCVVKH